MNEFVCGRMKKKKAILPGVLIAAVTAFIFSNSFKGIEDSRQDSDLFLNWFQPILERLVGQNAELMDYLVRKAAHLFEFFVLALLLCWFAKTLDKPLRGYGLLYTLSVAVTDEFIQKFFERTSSVSDVLIDFLGALIGFGAVFLICVLKKYVRNRKNSEHG